MKIKMLFLNLFAGLILTSCGSVKLPNTRVCAVSGKLSAGADCVYTGEETKEEMTFTEFMDFLEAQDAKPNPKDPSKMIPPHGAALCQSSEDYTKQKTALEQACRLLGNRCTPEIKKTLQTTWRRIEGLQEKTAYRNRPVVK